MKIAVIGAGIAGLATAWLLGRRHQVSLFERHATPGLVASSLSVHGVRVDVPLRVFYPGYYPTLTRLYAELGVATEPVSYATSFTDNDGSVFFRWRDLRLGSVSLPYVLPQDLAGARARHVALGALRFNQQARAKLARGELTGRRLDDLLAELRLPPEFVRGLLLPALATIATCSYADALQYPAEVVAGYLAAGLTRQSVRRAVHGADDVAKRLVAGIPRLVCAAGVSGVRREGARVRLLHDGKSERFEHVVLATQANQALALWQDASADEQALLRSFTYRPLEVLMHRDARFMPRRRGDWSPVTARVNTRQDGPESTIWVNAVQPALRRAPDVFQTVQPQRAPRAGTVIGRAFFERPLVDTTSQRALTKLQQLHEEPLRRVWLCGSYAQPGVPLLESAVRSAYAVAAAIEAAAPSSSPRRARAVRS